MNFAKTFSIIAFIAMTGCSQQLGSEDRALINDTRSLAMEAKNEAGQAQKSAAEARQTAKAANAKADRILRQSRKK